MIIQVVGLGLIGGSFCRAIRQNTVHTVLGMDICAQTVQDALAAGAIHAEGTANTLQTADLVIVCLYPEQAISFLLEHREDFRKGGIVCDACGVKASIVDAVSVPLCQSGVRFVGCHPMAGRELSGFGASKADLYDGASFIITPVAETDPDAIAFLEDFARSVGFGRTVTASPTEHDRIIAATSQLAHVVSNAYIKSPTLRKQAGFSAGSYLDLTRVAKLSEEMWTSLFLLNKKPLLFEIDTLIQNLQQYRDAIAANDADALRETLREGRKLKEADLQMNR